MEENKTISQEELEQLKRDAEQGDADSQYHLAVCYIEGIGVTQDYEQAIYWWKKVAEQGNANAQYNFGLCYENGFGLTVNLDEAVKWYKKAADQGSEKAKKRLKELGK